MAEISIPTGPIETEPYDVILSSLPPVPAVPEETR
ncbi:hypothetical protein FHR32_005107 [Streptosporangium album]|uniref:Uncharacterized protein n=1 Tax=Streptosporangium album TaxID=47479 RepID=A0A7W7RZ01_9ACTN|nr:hypothetical protein [Streptosporangium album]